MSSKKSKSKSSARSKRPGKVGPPKAQSPDAPTTAAPKPRPPARRRRRDRQQIFANASWIGLAVVVIGALLFWGLHGWWNEKRFISEVTSGSCTFDRNTDPGVSGEHSTAATFKVNPPSGGVHPPTAASPGDYSTATPPPEGQAVHALEHGDIDVWYRPDLPADQLEQLRQLQRDVPKSVLLLPRPNNPVPVAVTAWQKRLLCSQFEVEPIRKFTNFYKNKGPEKVVD